MYDVIIIGAGPAGLTAAIYALMANKKVLIFEARSYGGQIVNAGVIKNYPGLPGISGFEFATKLYDQVKSLGGEIKFETVIRIEKDKSVITKKGTYNAKAIIVATGASKRKLKTENEEKYIGRGVSYCATCDGNLYKGKNVAVVGSGKTAIEDAIYLSDIVNKVYLINNKEEFNVDKIYLDKLKGIKNIEILLNYSVVRINGDKKVSSIDIVDNKSIQKQIEVEGIFIAVGQEPQNDIFSNILELDEKGYIKTEDGVHTNVDKIYVAGDNKKKLLKQLVTAESDGAIAATVAIKEMER